LDENVVKEMRRRKRPLLYSFRLYLNTNGERVLGKGGAQILEAIEEYGSIAMAADELDMSYKFVWDYLERMQHRLRQPMIVTRRGGSPHRSRKGGGGTSLTPLARMLLRDFKDTETQVYKTLSKRKPGTVDNRAMTRSYGSKTKTRRPK
jgi:molybdate transport system regulatory protein